MIDKINNVLFGLMMVIGALCLIGIVAITVLEIWQFITS